MIVDRRGVWILVSVLVVCVVNFEGYISVHSIVAVSSAVILIGFAVGVDDVTDVAEALAQGVFSAAEFSSKRQWHFFLVRAALDSFRILFTYCALNGFVRLRLLSSACFAVLEPCCK